MKGPNFWVGQSVPRLGKIYSFEGGVYLVKSRGKDDLELFHYELMDAVGKARNRVEPVSLLELMDARYS